MDDIELVRRAMEGAEDAFDELLRRYEKPLLAYLCSKVKDMELALDLLQETFIDAFTGIKCLREPERFSSWLFTIARRKAWLARRKADEWEELPETIPIAPSAPDEVLRKELSELVRRAVEKLPEKLEQVVRMHYFDGMSYPEICRALDIPVSTLKSRLHLARERLRRELAPFVEDMPEMKSASKRREVVMEFKKPEVKIEAIPETGMEVELIELLNMFRKLEKGAKSEYVWFRNWADGVDEPVYLLLRSRVVGRAVVEGEECWEVKTEVRDPQGRLRSTQFLFCDRRGDGFYCFAGMSKGRGKATELYFSPEHGFRAFPSQLRLGMKSSAFGRELRVERVVNVRVNGRSIKALEAVYPAAPAKGVLRLNRTYIAENGRLALFERYHSFEGEPSGAAVNAPTRGSPRLFRQPPKPDVDQFRAGRGSDRLIRLASTRFIEHVFDTLSGFHRRVERR